MSGLTNMVGKASRMLGSRGRGTTGAQGHAGARRGGHGGAAQRRQDEKVGRAVRGLMRKVTR